jgi:RNA polymerase sigma factor (TIGR02999 family)
MSEVTRILQAVQQGDPQAGSQLLPLVYDELRRLAAQRLTREAPGQTLQPTALVHEAYLRLVASPRRESGEGEPHWDGRAHFFAACAEAMRRILVENARRKKRLRHGGGRQRVELEELDLAIRETPEEVLALDEALAQLAREDASAADVIKLHYFAGLSVEEAATALGISRASAYRHWTYARAWLRCALRGTGSDSAE